MVVLWASPALGRKPGWRTLQFLALSPLPSAPTPTPVWLCRENSVGERGGGRGGCEGAGRGWPPPSQCTETREFRRFPRGGLAFASSPIHFPFLLQTAPEQLRDGAVPHPASVASTWGGARQGAEVGRNVSGRLGLETEYSLLVATLTMC